MTQLAFNGSTAPVNPALSTWEELLTDLEASKLAENEVITSVHFDGDEILHFRNVDALSIPLNSLQEVRVEASGRNEMLRSAVQDAQSYLSSLKSSMFEIAEMFRSDRSDQGNARLHQRFEGLKTFIALSRGIELSLCGISTTEGSVVEKAIEQMAPTLEDQIGAQAQSDWMLLADILEYDLVPNLKAFDDILAGFKARLGLN
jgi:hypothetical protein